MAHTATATEYRPQNFSSLVGQDFVSTAIKNSLNSKKIPNAFLLSGPRGVGKTTTARLIAKGLNCIHGPTGEPCNNCPQCISIKEGNNSDVIEIDGASNTSINNIKIIQEEIQYLPAAAKYKIYIIDEVHMLSKSAFNALLKTIEEPPEHVVFIFATTELNEVPATIKSRCQQFNLRLIPHNIIENNIKKILTDKNISFDDDSVKWIAKEGKGSLRDAYTLLDQIISFCGNEITLNKIQSKLGLAGKEQISQLITCILNEQIMDIHLKLSTLLNSGCRIEQILSDIISFFRDILLLKSHSSSDDIKNNSSYYSPEILEKLSIYDVENILDLSFGFYEKLKYSINQEMELEFFLIKLSRYKDFIRPEALLKQIKTLQTSFIEKKKLVEIPKSEINKQEIHKSDLVPEVKPISQQPVAAKIEVSAKEQPLLIEKNVIPEDKDETKKTFSDYDINKKNLKQIFSCTEYR